VDLVSKLLFKLERRRGHTSSLAISVFLTLAACSRVMPRTSSVR
jgi:hypothetical protein